MGLGALAGQLAAQAHLWPSQTFAGMGLRYVQARFASRQPVWTIPAGGSSPAGVLGWLAGGLEIADQLAHSGAPPFDVVYVTIGTGGTAAGLWLGLGQAANALRGVRVVPWPIASEQGVRFLAGRARSLLRRLTGESLTPGPQLSVDGRFVGPGIGYGAVTEASRRAVALAGSAGLGLETTYTGKTLAALLADADAGLLHGKRVLFVNTVSSVDLSALRARADLSLLPGHSVLHSLDVTLLHALVIEQSLGIDRAAQESQTYLRYVKDNEQALVAAREPDVQAVVMMNPTKVTQVMAGRYLITSGTVKYR